jgi:5,10-methylenetetrahydrofolate reductase
VTFRLDRPSAKTVTLSVQTVVGTADATDFTPISTTVTIPAGSTTVRVTVAVVADAAVEPPETFSVHVTRADNARVSVADAVVTINPPTA